MIDVTAKPVVRRTARAAGGIRMKPETAAAIREKRVPKGDVLETARVAGIMAAKNTPDILPMCHPIALTGVKVAFEVKETEVRIEAWTHADDKTGVEMEALCAVSAAALCIYDMCKGLDKGMEITKIVLLEKTKEEIGA